MEKIEDTVKKLKNLTIAENIILIERRKRILLINLLAVLFFLIFVTLRNTIKSIDNLMPFYSVNSILIYSVTYFFIYWIYYGFTYIVLLIIFNVLSYILNHKEIKKEREIIIKLNK